MLRRCLVGLVVLVAAAGCTRESPTPTPTPVPTTVPSATATPSESTPAVPTGRTKWTFEAVKGGDIAATPGGYVLSAQNRQTNGYDIVGLTKDGTRRWQKAVDATEVGATVTVTGATVITSRKNPARTEWPGSRIIEAFDADSGAALWRDDQPSFLTVLAGTAYTSVCHGGQNNRIGDCRLSARDARTGGVKWTISTYASAQIGPANDLPEWPAERLAAPAVPPYLVVYSFPTGHDSQTWTTVDPKSGRSLGLSVRAAWVVQTAAALIVVDREQNKASLGCKTTLVARKPVGGGELWRRTFTTAPQTERDRCDDPRVKAGDGLLTVTDRSGLASVLSGATGQTVWTAGEPGEVVALSRTEVVVQHAAGGLTVFDQGRQRWRTGSLSAYKDQARLHVFAVRGGLAAFDFGESAYCLPNRCPKVSVFEASSGTLRQEAVGRFVAVSDGLIVTEVEDRSGTSTYRAYEVGAP